MSASLSSALVQRGYQVEVWTSNVIDQTGRRVPAGLSSEHGVTVKRYAYVLTGLFRFSNLLVTPGMAIDAVLTDSTPSLVHVHDFRSFQTVAGYTLAKTRKRPLIVQPRGTVGFQGKRRVKMTYDFAIGRRILQYATRILALSEEEAEVFKAARIPHSKISVVPNGVRIPDQTELVSRGRFRKRLGIGDDDFVILFLGRLRKSKGAELLVDAFERLSSDHGTAKLVLCGADEGSAGGIMELSRKRGLSVYMPGVVLGPEKADAFVDSDVFCLPSFSEAQSIALLEAASFGLPIVAGTASVPSQFITSGAGRFSNLNPIAIASSLAELADSPLTRRSLGLKAREVVQREFSLESTVERLQEVYQAAIEGWDNSRLL